MKINNLFSKILIATFTSLQFGLAIADTSTNDTSEHQVAYSNQKSVTIKRIGTIDHSQFNIETSRLDISYMLPNRYVSDYKLVQSGQSASVNIPVDAKNIQVSVFNIAYPGTTGKLLNLQISDYETNNLCIRVFSTAQLDYDFRSGSC